MSVVRLPTEGTNSGPKRAKLDTPPALSFSNEDKIGTIQPHDDALVITLRIRGYDMKKVMVDQGSAAKIMYPDLYNGAKLKARQLNNLRLSVGGLQWEDYHPKGLDQATSASRIRGGGGRLHRGGCLFPLHSYCGQTLASCLGSRLIYSALESEIPLEGSH